ncbi:c-type cytochrome [Erwinia sp.]|uniref:cytochrome c n=1 Tax=Erwinia citreus TaxID=558 RepID=UPI003C7155AF
MLGQHAASAETPAELIKRGEYLAIAGDCGACHSDAGKAPFSGGHAIVSPIGTLFSTNITPSKTAGIGNYSEAQFADALRKGVRGDGRQLYPAMPYTAYAKLSDDDVSALYAYFMHGVKAVDKQPQKTELPFPFNLRFSMAGWNLLFLETKPFTPDASQSAEWNRGAYLVQGLTHCSTCHTPRNFLMAEQQDKSLQGASLGTWFAPDITAKTLQDKQRWTRESLAEYLETGHAANGATAGGPMLEAVDKSFSRMTAEDRQAIANYLLPEVKEESASTHTPVSPSTIASDSAAEAGSVATAGLSSVAGDDTPEALSQMSAGEGVYRNNCASCHNLGGVGLNGLPALKGHPVLEKPTADNVAMAVLQGVWPEKGQGMIGFAKELNDRQIADVTNYVMKDMGNSSVQITPERVKALRHGGEPSSLLLLARAGMAGGVVVILALLFWWWRRRR